LLSGGSGEIKMWNIKDFYCIKTIKVDRSNDYFLVLPNIFLVTGHSDQVKIWEIDTFTCVNVLTDSKERYITSLPFFSKDKRIAALKFTRDEFIAWKY
jgi:hypothetical protein